MCSIRSDEFRYTADWIRVSISVLNGSCLEIDNELGRDEGV